MISSRSTPLTDALTLLHHLWSHETKQATPTMFDAVAVAYAIDAQQCLVTPLHLEVDAEGTRVKNLASRTPTCVSLRTPIPSSVSICNVF
jgi:hypothetical protein